MWTFLSSLGENGFFSLLLRSFSVMGTMRDETGHKGWSCADGFLSVERTGKAVGVGSVQSMLDFRVGDLVEEDSDGCE
jgi:hypothetical protein